MDYVACTSKKYFPDPKLVEECRAFAKESGGSVTLTESVEEACTGADVIYTDVWVSRGSPTRSGRSESGSSPPIR